jgi:hypothetical protein
MTINVANEEEDVDVGSSRKRKLEPEATEAKSIFLTSSLILLSKEI